VGEGKGERDTGTAVKKGRGIPEDENLGRSRRYLGRVPRKGRGRRKRRTFCTGGVPRSETTRHPRGTRN